MIPGTSARFDFFRYCGMSMWPCFQQGDLLEIQPVAFAELRVGDCVVYRMIDCETPVTHRISNIDNGIIRTRGDAHLKLDEFGVSANQIIGRVVGRYRLGILRPVQGGIKGRLLGGINYYVGRFDPQRAARGGRVARLLRSSMQWLAGCFYRNSTVQEFGDINEERERYWLIGQRPWARFASEEKRWLVPWPQSLLIDPARLPCRTEK